MRAEDQLCLALLALLVGRRPEKWESSKAATKRQFDELFPAMKDNAEAWKNRWRVLKFAAPEGVAS